MRGRCATICAPTSTTRARWPGSWRTTTSRERAATFAPGMYEAAAVITFLSTGMRFFHQGQFEGRKKRISPHLVRAPKEPADETLNEFYKCLLGVLRQQAVREGQWHLLACVPAWGWQRDVGFFPDLCLARLR